ncbi:MAG: SCP-like extracellular [Sphingomonadales bacterium]|nr:SCP-like extracellular [Sphingomonadales bacterium]
MSRRRLTSLIASLALLFTLPVTVGATDPTSNFADRVLGRHNRERVAMGIAPLQWDPMLAASAQDWANYLARSGRFEHAPERAFDPQGENLWAGTRGAFSLEHMVDAWIREKRYFTPGVFPNNSTTGRVEDIGHYTQLMWRDSGEVGCAIARGRVEDVLVCRYSDAGNYIGERPF